MKKLVLVALLTLTWTLRAQEPAVPSAPSAPGAKPPKPETDAVKPEDKCRVEGNIYSAKTGEPLKKAEVHLQRIGGGNPMPVQHGATTDAAGHFTIENVDPGPYSLMASRTGYVTTSYGSKGKQGAGTTLTLSPGQKVKDLAIKLPVQGVVTGRVLDDDGEPMANVSVQLMRHGFVNGKRQMWPMGGGGNANDKGEYRIFGVAPGKYYAVANYRSNWGFSMPEMRNDKGEQMSYVPIFYPNALSYAEGARIDVTSGNEVAGIDFRMVKARSLKISGKVLNTGGTRNIGIQLMPRDSEGGPQWERMSNTMLDAKGNFTFRDVRPGDYTLSAMMWGEEQKSAHAQVTVADADVEGLQLSFGTNPDVSGSVRVEGATEWIKQPVAVALRQDTEGISFGGGSGEVKEDGTFKLKNVPLEKVRLELWPVPDGHYFKAVRAGDTESDSRTLDFSEGVPGELTVILSDKAATISGSVQDAKQKPVTSGMVMAVPENRKRWDLFYTTTPDQNGQYTLKNMHPGSYKLFAVDNAEQGQDQDPEFLKTIEDKGESISVKDSEKGSKDLTVIVTEERQ